MKFKRHYKTPKGWVKQVDGQGNCTNPPPLDYLEVIDTGSGRAQNFSTRFVAAGIQAGYVAIGEGKLTVKAKPEALVYEIVRTPGRYCCHCAAKLEDAAALAQAHVATEHKGKKSPDPTNPAGYAMINAYECVLDAKQHEKFHAAPIGQKRKGA